MFTKNKNKKGMFTVQEEQIVGEEFLQLTALELIKQALAPGETLQQLFSTKMDSIHSSS